MERADILRKFSTCGIQSTPQRIEIAEIIFKKKQHLSAEQLLERLRAKNSAVSKATVYNTLGLFVERGLLKQFAIKEGSTVFDPNTTPHHHFVEIESGAIVDIPWEDIQISGVEGLEGFDVSDYQVVMRGTQHRK